MSAFLRRRTSGILAHVTSLPGPHGCGDLGDSSRAWLDYLARSGQSVWQMLPVGPVGYGSSPYSALSAFAGSPLIIALEPLVEAGWLRAESLEDAKSLPRDHVDYAATSRFRMRCLREAFDVFQARGAKDDRAASFREFSRDKRAWLDGFAFFTAIKRAQGDVEWTRWPAPLRDRDPAALAEFAREHGAEIDFQRFVQWLFFEQWRALRAEAQKRNIALVGDLPIFVAHDSADVWEHKDIFHLDESGMPTVVSGVPPDYFSATGQRWGNPLYRWKRLRKRGYGWWIDRLRITLERFDAVRLDHFIGFQRFWQVPASESTAENGRWMKGPGEHFFATVRDELGTLPLIAEDLGAVTPAVKRLRDQFKLAGIKILQFAFGNDPNAHDFLPHNYPRRSVAYTGTHDNDTTLGWFHARGGEGETRDAEQIEKERRRVMEYVGVDTDRDVHWAMIRAVEASVARTVIFPLQDVLGLGNEARMNRPGTSDRNWEWRCEERMLGDAISDRLATLARTYDRAPSTMPKDAP